MNEYKEKSQYSLPEPNCTPWGYTETTKLGNGSH